MATHSAKSPELLKVAHKIDGRRTKKSTVNEALEENVRRRVQRRILDLFGTIDYDPDYDYKRQRT